MDSSIKVTRETEFYQGFIRFKMSVSNEASFVITDVDLYFRFDDDLLRIDSYEPASYQKKNGKIILGNIDAGRSKSIAVLFDPLLCSKGTDINCQINYKDAQGKFNSAFMEAKTISFVCPIKTDSDINIGRLKEFIENLPSRDSKVYEIHQGFDVPKLAGIAREVVEKHDVRHIRTLHTKDGRNCEIWYYGKTKIHKDDIVIKISIDAEKCMLELFAATRSAEVLTGLLAEIGRDLKHGVEFRVSGKGNVINVTIKDSVIQRSNLLDLCNMDGTCPVNILVEDSVIQHSTFISEREEAKEERLRKDREEQERLLKQQDEENRLKKAEEEKLRRDKEEEERQCYKREAEARLKQEMEELRKQRVKEENKKKENEAQERKHREEKERKRREEEEEEKARREREVQGRLRKKREEADKKAREELERKKFEESRKVQAAKPITKPPYQQKVLPKIPLSPPTAKKKESSSGKGILVFGLIFGIILIGTAAALLGSDGGSEDIPPEIQPVPVTPSENTEKDAPETIVNSDQAASSKTDYTNTIGMEFVEIPAGEFMMGTPLNENGTYKDEGPAHKGTIKEAFYLGKFEVTQEQWRGVMGNNTSYFTGDDLPVEQVSWNDVQEFIEKLNEMEGTNKYRLPSEAEWEYACRAGTTTGYYFGTRYYFGDDESKLGDYAWYTENSGSENHPVGQKKPNPWGLYDMHGNVYEWVQDRWHGDYYGAPSDGSAWEDGGSSDRVFRGGSWRSYAGDCRSASRDYYSPGNRNLSFGFRVLRKL